MSRFPFIPLDVVAKPVSNFAAPEVRAKGSSLEALARSLASIEPRANNILERRSDAFIKQSIQKGQADAARYQNMAAFKAAVDGGHIDEAANPHYLDAIRQEVARSEAEQTFERAKLAYDSDTTGVKGSEDLGRVQQFIDSQFQPLADSLDPVAMEAAAPVIQQSRAALMSHHVKQTLNEREDARTVSLKNVLMGVSRGMDSTTLDGLTSGDVNVGADSEARALKASQAVQAELERASQTMSRTKAEKIAVDALLSAGWERKDARLAESLMSRVTTKDGQALSDTADGRSALDTLNDKVREYNRTITREAREDEKVAEDKQTKTAFGAVLSKLTELRKTDPNASILDVTLSVSEIEKMDPEVRYRMEIMRNTMLGMEKSQRAEKFTEQELSLATELYGDGLTGKLDHDRELDIAKSLAAIGHSNVYSNFLQDRRSHDLSKEEHESDKAVELNFSRLAKNGELTMDDVNQARELSQLTRRDWVYWMERSAQSQSGVRDGVPPDTYEKDIQEQIIGGSLSRNEYTDYQKTYEAQVNKITAARSTFLKEAHSILQQNPSMNYMERAEKLGALRDQIAKEYGGLDYKGWQDWAKGKSAENAPTKDFVPKNKAEEKVVQAEGPMVEAIKNDPRLRGLTLEDLAEADRIRNLPVPDGDLRVNLFYPSGFTPFADVIPGGPGSMRSRLAEGDELGTLQYAAKQSMTDKTYLPLLRSAVTKAVQRRDGLARIIESQGTVQSLKEKLKLAQGYNNITPEERARILARDGAIREYILLSQSLPAAAGTIPWFDSKEELISGGKDRAEKLGITTPEGVAEFIKAQKKSIDDLNAK
jgi:hypothetical protein